VSSCGFTGLTDVAATAMSTSAAPGVGTGTSLRTCTPAKSGAADALLATAARIVEGRRRVGAGATTLGATHCSSPAYISSDSATPGRCSGCGLLRTTLPSPKGAPVMAAIVLLST
jgi:hypothetical protein